MGVFRQRFGGVRQSSQFGDAGGGLFSEYGLILEPVAAWPYI